MENNYNSEFDFFVVSGTVRDESANPVENMIVALRYLNKNHETEIIAISKTDSFGKYYIEESLKIGSELVVECYDVKDNLMDSKDFVLKKDVRIDFVIKR